MSILDTLKSHQIRAKKSLGQNFLIDPNSQSKIVNALKISPHDTVLEVGPGIGSLTKWIIEANPAQLILIEKDPTFLPILQALLKDSKGSFRLHQGDALDFDLKDLHVPALKIISNLPYNISAPLIIEWIKHGTIVLDMVLMVQKEVAERIIAVPNTKNYGRLSVICQFLCECKILFHVPPTVFRPQPKVTSTVIRLTPKPHQPTNPCIMAMEKLTSLLFQKRRKMLKGILKDVLTSPEAALERLNIPPTYRPENLTIPQLSLLSQAVFDSTHES